MSPTTQSFRASYESLLPVAMAVPAAQILISHVEAAVALANARKGVLAIQPEAERLARELPAIQLDDLLHQDRGLVSVAEAFFYAARTVDGTVSSKEIERRLRAISEPRQEMLAVARTLARRGLLPRERVETIRKGSGRLDLATDAVLLASLFQQHAAQVAGQHPFTEAEIQQLLEDGEWLVRNLSPAGVRPATPSRAAGVPSGAEVRDRFYTLLASRHDTLRRAGAYLFGEEVDRRVPRLNARSLAPRDGTTDEAVVAPEAPAVPPSA